MRFTQLQSFLAIVEAGGVRAAALQLGVSQPTLTKTLRLLEQDLGIALFARGARGMTLTQAGRALLPRARAIQAEAQRARQELARLGGAEDGSLGIGVAPSAAMGLAPQAIVALRQRWPRSMIRVVDSLYPNVLQLLRERDIDVALEPRIGPRPEPHSDIVMQPLLLNEVCIVVRRGHPLADATSLAALTDSEWLRSGPPGGPSTVIERAFKEADLPLPRIFVQCESFLALPDIVANSDVVAIVPSQIVEQHGARAGLVQVRVRERLNPTEVSLLTRAGEPQTPLLKDFVEIVHALVAKGAMNWTPLHS
ncbi:MAG: LysR family transcriptional regulator [Burkholderiales bacterium]|nr:LysR family transcriptional regulator [Burkholderiales bacterium]ODU71783.1 MAG: hypothetical protein ABT05_00900 [Lautropia sp. SCN 66-9]